MEVRSERICDLIQELHDEISAPGGKDLLIAGGRPGYRISLFIEVDWEDLVGKSKESQKELARRANVSAQYLNDVMYGRRIPPVETAYRIARACGQPLADPRDFSYEGDDV